MNTVFFLIGKSMAVVTFELAIKRRGAVGLRNALAVGAVAEHEARPRKAVGQTRRHLALARIGFRHGERLVDQ